MSSQILAGAGPYTLTKTWEVDGTATDVGAVTIGIVDGNGDTVVSSGTSTTNNADGTYTYSLADQANVDQLTVTWTRSGTGADLSEQLELVGSWLFTESQLRAHDDAAITASDYTDDQVADTHLRVVDYLEHQTGQSFIRRYNRVVIPGSGRNTINLADGDPQLASGFGFEPSRFGQGCDSGVVGDGQRHRGFVW